MSLFFISIYLQSDQKKYVDEFIEGFVETLDDLLYDWLRIRESEIMCLLKHSA